MPRCCRPICARARADLLPNPGAQVRPVGGAQHRRAPGARRHHRLPRCRRCLRTRPPGAPAAAGGAVWRRDRPDARGRSAHASRAHGQAAAGRRVPADRGHLRAAHAVLARLSKGKCPAGWPPIDFAEDVILNVDLYCASGAYPFVEDAEYIYHLSEGSRSHSLEALQRARSGYLQILELVETRDWPPAVRELVRRVFKEDLAAVERAQDDPATPGGRRCATARRDSYAADNPSRASRRRSQAIMGSPAAPSTPCPRLGQPGSRGCRRRGRERPRCRPPGRRCCWPARPGETAAAAAG